MARKKINMSELAFETGISRNTISKIYHEETSRLDIITLEKLCKYFNCTIEEMIILNKKEFEK